MLEHRGRGESFLPLRHFWKTKYGGAAMHEVKIPQAIFDACIRLRGRHRSNIGTGTLAHASML